MHSTERGVTNPCALGSIKTNFGHTEAASGVAGLIKTALILRHRIIPPSLHCKTPNPKIEWDRRPIRVATEIIDLNAEPGRLLVGVSSFGITGTNAHIVLEEAEQPTSVQRRRHAMRIGITSLSALSRGVAKSAAGIPATGA